MSIDASRRYIVSGVCCTTEEGVLRKCLNAGVGRDNYSFDAATCVLTVSSSVDDRTVLSQVRRGGFDARGTQEPARSESFWSRHRVGIASAAATVLALAGLILEEAGRGNPLSRGLLVAAVLVGGWRIFVKAAKAVHARSLDMNVLMSVAVLGALCIGKWGEGAAVIVLFSVSLMLESYSTARTRRAIQSLVSLSPQEARVLTARGEETVPAESVEPGCLVSIRPGEKLPLDGIVERGFSSLNQAAITGESVLVEKRPNSQVFAGSVNGQGALVVLVTKRFEETTLARIIHLIEEAHQERAPVQNTVDRFARVYTPFVFLLAIGIWLVPSLLLHQPPQPWLYKALVLLVIACPCALVISTPVTLVSALTNAARHRMLIKGGTHLETLSSVRVMAFDKTGTLTEGRPRITDVVSLNSLSRNEVLRLAAAVEHRSEHHLAAAVAAEASRAGLDYSSVPVEEFEALPGMGAKARIGGVMYYVGNQRLGDAHGFLTPEVAALVQTVSSEGKTPILVGRTGEPVGVLAAIDTARRHGAEAIARLRHAGIREVVLLSGDEEVATQKAAREIGVSSYRYGLLPEEKKEAVEELKRRHGVVAMVGDGINDAPALASSSVGIAMGVAGTDVALETADVVLMSDDLSRLPHLLGLSKKALAVVRQNIALALSLKLLFLVLSLLGYSTLWMAVLADDGAALAVIANGLRLLRYKEQL